MGYSHRYHAYPSQEVAKRLERHIDVHRQAYNYALYEYENVDADDIGSAYKHRSDSPTGKTSSPSSRRSKCMLGRAPRGRASREFRELVLRCAVYNITQVVKPNAF